MRPSFVMLLFVVSSLVGTIATAARPSVSAAPLAETNVVLVRLPPTELPTKLSAEISNQQNQADRVLLVDSQQPVEVDSPSNWPAEWEAGCIESQATGWSLADVEQLATSTHPAIAEAAARVRAARCRQYQVGRPPNPTIGYLGSEIGADGTAGQQGMYFGQDFIRGGKLGLDQCVVAGEIQRLQEQLAAVRLQVLTDVRTAYFEAAFAQQQVTLTEKLVTVSKQAVSTVEELIAAAEGRRTDLLQAQIEADRTAASLSVAISRQQAAWRRLTALVGQAGLQQQPLVLDEEALRWSNSWDSALSQLLASSPEVSAAIAEVHRTRAALQRAGVEPISDVSAQVSVQYDHADQNTIAGVQVGMPLAIWNRNRGGIGEARANVNAAMRALERTELRLQQQLAARVQQYEAAYAQAEAYRNGILSRAEESLSLVEEGYAAGELTFLDRLTMQRTYFEASLEYLNALRRLNESVQLLRGLLLSDAVSGIE